MIEKGAYIADIGFVSNKLSFPIFIIEKLFKRTKDKWNINPIVAVQIVKLSIIFLFPSEKIPSKNLDPILSIIIF